MISNNISRIMWVSGLLTASMFMFAIAPTWAMELTFGQSLDGALAEVIVRNWGFLIGVIGLLLIYGASRPAMRPPVLAAAIATKTAYVVLWLTVGQAFLPHVAIAVAFDSVVICLFVAYLFRRAPAA